MHQSGYRRRRWLRLLFLLTCLGAIVVSAPCQSDYWSAFLLTPGVTLPVGAPAEMFAIGGGAELSWQYPMPFAPALSAQVGLDYTLLPVRSVDNSPNLNLLTFAGGAGASLDVLPRFSIRALGSVGYGLGIYGPDTGGSLFYGAQAGAIFSLTRALGIGAGAAYRHYVSRPTPFYQGIRFHLGVTLRLGTGAARSNLGIENIELHPLFPVLYHHYEDHSFGSVTLTNNERDKITDVRVTFYVPQYMEQPEQCGIIPELARGDSATVPVVGLFTNEVLANTEGTRVTAEVTVEYTYAGEIIEQSASNSLQLYDRNAITWDDDEKAAAFVTSKDPGVLQFSKQVAGSVRDDSSTAVNLVFRIALGMFEALQLHGMQYVVDPQSPYASFSEQTESIDYLQFPTQTITYKAGDCDDLSVLYSALLESVGIETGFITTPGHIYAAFSLGMPPAEARRVFGESQDLIYRGDMAWVPVETTMVQDGFLEAWARGAKQWRESALAGNAEFYPVHEAWGSYRAVGLPNSPEEIPVPSEDAIRQGYRDELRRFVEREIASRVEVFEERIRSERRPERWLNGLGVLYAQFGLLANARDAFERSAALGYPQATVNLANVYFLEKDFQRSLEFFEEAAREDPNDAVAHLGLAKTNFELENHVVARNAFERVAELDAELADRFSYLVSAADETSRASAAMVTETVVWDVEE